MDVEFFEALRFDAITLFSHLLQKTIAFSVQVVQLFLKQNEHRLSMGHAVPSNDRTWNFCCCVDEGGVAMRCFRTSNWLSRSLIMSSNESI